MAGLKAFRLTDIDVNVRMRAAGQVIRSTGISALAGQEVDPADRLFATLLSNVDAGGNTMDADVIRRVAQTPSSRVYWISRNAWDKVMGA